MGVQVTCVCVEQLEMQEEAVVSFLECVEVGNHHNRSQDQRKPSIRDCLSGNSSVFTNKIPDQTTKTNKHKGHITPSRYSTIPNRKLVLSICHGEKRILIAFCYY